MADQLVLDIPGVTATWATLQPGDRIRHAGHTWDVVRGPEPSIWGTLGHPAHCDACIVHTGPMPAPDCDRHEPEPYVSVFLQDVADRYHYWGTHQPADEPVEVVRRA